MSEEVWKYLQYVPNTNKKAVPGIKRKPQIADKQVLNLTGGLFPMKLVEGRQQKNTTEKVDHWMYAPIRQKNPLIGPIYHWVKEGQQQKMYHGDKFNIETKSLEFSEQQYSKIHVSHEQWPYDRVVELFDKLKNHNFNFIVARDRLQKSPKWTVEDLKEIYFTVSRLILQQRGQSQNLLSTYMFDKKYEINRKYELEKYMMRSSQDTQREKALINEIKRLEILIKKEEREQINLKRALKLEEPPQQVVKLNKQVNIDELWKKQKVFSRQQYLGKPLHLPGKIQERLTDVLHGLNIPDKIIATKQNTKLYDNLRKNILLMFSLQRYARKKENEKRTIEEKKKKLDNFENEERNKVYPLKVADGQPKKKVHKN